jgi:KipI family sensor histidine kinase inhibitor
LVRFLPSGDTAIVIELGSIVDRAISARVLALSRRVEALKLAGVVETVPTFRSLMVHYDPLRTTHAALRDQIAPLVDEPVAAGEDKGRLWVLPTCYEPRFGLDLAELAERTGLTTAEVVRLFSTTIFNVYMLGFLPGHPYLGDTPKALYLPRRDVPRVKVPPGSVATAIGQAVVYPLETPGGWHIVGRTPVRCYDPRREVPVFFAPNDKIRFDAIGIEEHDRLEAEAAAGRLEIAPQPVPAEVVA